MTISSTVRSAGPFAGDNASTVFTFAFKVFADTDLSVIKLTIATGVETTLALTTHYTVALNADQNTNPGGTVTLLSPLLDEYSLTINSAVPQYQPTDLTNLGGFYPQVVTDALDRITILLQQFQTLLGKNLQYPVSDPSLGVVLPTAKQRASSLMAFDATGAVVVGPNIASVGTVTANVANINALAAIAANITTVAGVAAYLASIAAMAADIAAVGAVTTEIANVEDDLTNIDLVAADLTNIDAAVADLVSLAAKMNLDGSNLAIGSDADGDMYYRASNVLARLAKGTANYKLFMNAAGTNPEWASGIHIGTFTRAMDATGAPTDVSYTGLPFKPSALIIFSSLGNASLSAGIADSSHSYVQSVYGGATTYYDPNDSNCIWIIEQSGKEQKASLKTFDSNGFTLTWTKVGSPASANAQNYYIAFR